VHQGAFGMGDGVAEDDVVLFCHLDCSILLQLYQKNNQKCIF
jgi:hypothetical protein